MIYKKGNRADPSNWRPITISSVLLRMFHRVLANRLRIQARLNTNQRGFAQLDGTMANVVILETFLKARAAATSTSAIVGIDVTKAFDTVSHESIHRGLIRMNIEHHLKSYIVSSLQGNYTIIRLGEHTTREIAFNRGVKQGDPISPILFNIVLDEFVQLSNTGGHGGTINNDSKVATLAFADDLILMEDSPDRMILSLSRAGQFLRSRGMDINPQKCFSATTMRHRGALKPVNRSTYIVNGQNIPAVTDVNPVKYLGYNVCSQAIVKPNLQHLDAWLKNTIKAPLKPPQKLALIKEQAVPKMMYYLQGPHTTASQLKTADIMIKNAVKSALHLHVHTPDAALYASTKDGGLGMTELLTVIPKITKERIERLRVHIEDESLAAALDGPIVQSIVERLNRLCRPAGHRDLWRERLKEAPLLKGLEQEAVDLASNN